MTQLGDFVMTQRMFGFLLALVMLPFVAHPFAAEARGTPESFADLAEALTPAVVSISTESYVGNGESFHGVPEGTPFDEFFEDFFNRYGDDAPQQSLPTSLGSGFIISAEGHVVTNVHVIEAADKIIVRLNDDREYEAEVLGADPKTDIALLKIEADEDLPFVSFGDSDVVRVGDWALAIGNPFGFGSSVTAGIISARQRDINSGPYDEFLQTDAPINRGNSGGPLFNMDGEVIGVNTAIYSPSGGSVGIGFAVPSNIVERVIDQLSEFGRTRRGWLGVRIQSISPEIAEGFGLPSDEGALVASVTPHGPAEVAGLEAGDVIILFNGEDIEEMSELPRAVAETEVDTAVEVVVIRAGEEMTFEVVLGELEEFEEQLAAQNGGGDSGADKTKPSSEELLGMSLRSATPDLAQQFGRSPDTEGLLVLELKSGGPAARAGLQPGDLILDVGKVAVETAEEFAAEIVAAQERDARSVVLRVDRDDNPQFLAVQLDE
ncbi:MAG: serine protease [Rhodospirillaceae bacterium]|nr:serine protease [Rhodospirillaceae bacterium]|tara:strand:- start:4096 stop:5571 length:1476 start_codon:yes stop_codon:yes gene_type:complete